MSASPSSPRAPSAAPPPPSPPEGADAPADAWGGPPFSPGDTPYPPDHPTRQMLDAPPAPPPDPGRLGGLFFVPPGLAQGLPFAAAIALQTTLAGLLWVGAPMAARVDPRSPALAYLVAPGAALLLGALHRGALALHLSRQGGAYPRGARLAQGATLLLALGWLTGGLTGASMLTTTLPWASAVAALIALVLGTQALAGALDAPPLNLPFIHPHRIAQALTLGAGVLLPAAMALGVARAELTLAERLLTVGLVVHLGLAQRAVGQDTPGGHALRVGALCVAYRWALWVGGLLPMVCLALHLGRTPLATQGLALAGPLGALGVLSWIWLSVRAAQVEQ